MTFESCRVWAFLRVIGLPVSLVAGRSTLSPGGYCVFPDLGNRGRLQHTAHGECRGVTLLLRNCALRLRRGEQRNFAVAPEEMERQDRTVAPRRGFSRAQRTAKCLIPIRYT